MSDTMTLKPVTGSALDRQSSRLVVLAAAVMLAAIAVVAVVALAWPTSSSEPAREGIGATTAVAERIDCRPGHPC